MGSPFLAHGVCPHQLPESHRWEGLCWAGKISGDRAGCSHSWTVLAAGEDSNSASATPSLSHGAIRRGGSFQAHLSWSFHCTRRGAAEEQVGGGGDRACCAHSGKHSRQQGPLSPHTRRREGLRAVLRGSLTDPQGAGRQGCCEVLRLRSTLVTVFLPHAHQGANPRGRNPPLTAR